MATIPVYRIQHREDGSGPYFGSRPVGSSLEYSGIRHPEPQDDGLDWKAIRKNRLCGFADEESMGSWFSARDAAFLHSMGFAVAVYSVEEKRIARGKRQVLFPERRVPGAPIHCRVPLLEDYLRALCYQPRHRPALGSKGPLQPVDGAATPM